MSYVGLPTQDMSGEDFKFGSIVKPGHKGIWAEPLRTGKYSLNPHCYGTIVVPTSILTLNWAEASSQAHDLDRALSPIDGKSREGFEFSYRPPGADPRAGRQGAEGDQHGRLDAEPRQRGAAERGRQPLPQHAPEPARGHVHRDPRPGPARGRGVHRHATSAATTSRRAASTSRTSTSRRSSSRCSPRARSRTSRRRRTSRSARRRTSASLMEKSRGIAEQQAQLAASQVAIDIAANGASAQQGRGARASPPSPSPPARPRPT